MAVDVASEEAVAKVVPVDVVATVKVVPVEVREVLNVPPAPHPLPPNDQVPDLISRFEGAKPSDSFY